MKKLLLTTAALLAMSMAAQADSISLVARVDGTIVGTATSSNGTLDISDQSFGVFNLNSLTINSQSFLAPPGILNTNTLDVDQSAGGNHQLMIDIVASGLTGPNALQALLSEFSVTGLTTGWSAQESTTINGVLLSTTPVFTVNSASQDTLGAAFLGSTFSADVHYLVNSVGVGQFNGGIDINTASVPGPIVGAGIPGLMAAFSFFGLNRFRRRKQTTAA